MKIHRNFICGLFITVILITLVLTGCASQSYSAQNESLVTQTAPTPTPTITATSPTPKVSVTSTPKPSSPVNTIKPSPTPTPTPSPTKPSPTVKTATPAKTPVTTPTPEVISPESTTIPEISGIIPERVDVVYFHRAVRCVTCKCFETHITNVIKADFQDEISSGKLTYQVINIGDKANKAIAEKYKTIGSELFINSIIDGKDNIENIQEIWKWNCTKDGAGFELKVKNAIEARLQGGA
jgi:hypothetical protein